MYKGAILLEISITCQLGPRIDFDGGGKFSQECFQDVQDGEFLRSLFFNIMFAASLILSSQKVYKNIILLYMLLEQEYHFIIIIIFLDKAFNFSRRNFRWATLDYCEGST